MHTKIPMIVGMINERNVYFNEPVSFFIVSKVVEQGQWSKYDGLEITATGYTFTTVDNMFSEYNGKPVVRLQFSLKNTEDSANKLSYLDLKAFDPSGVETKGLDTYFDDSTWNSPNLQKNASGTAAYYFAYTTNGEYSITFGMLDTYVTLKFTVNK